MRNQTIDDGNPGEGAHEHDKVNSGFRSGDVACDDIADEGGGEQDEKELHDAQHGLDHGLHIDDSSLISRDGKVFIW